MKTRPVVLALIFALLSLAAVTGVSAATPTPTKRDHADAVYFYKAAIKIDASMYKKYDAKQQEAVNAIDGCPDAYTGASQKQIRDAEDVVSNVLFLQHILPDYATLKRLLVSRHAKNGVLKTIARNVVTINGQLQKYHRLTIDICVLGQNWAASNWDASYLDTWANNLDTESGFSSKVVAYAADKIASQSSQLTKSFGLKSDQVNAIIGVTTLYSR